MTLPLDAVTGAGFERHLHETFRISLEGIAPIDLELVAVSYWGETPPAERRRPFTLLFLGPESSTYLLQHAYRLEHATMGAYELFIVPLGLREGRMQYEAVFS
jgi:hypothetical protein